MRRALVLSLLLGCLVITTVGVLHWDASFHNPTSIFWKLSLPLAVALLAAAFLALPTSGQLVLASVLVTIGILELGAWMLNTQTAPIVETWVDPEYYQADPVLGWVPKPGITTRAWKRVEGETSYDVQYAIDAQGRRMTPAGSGGPHRSFLLFFGGSCTFGEGVNNTETLPYFVAEQAPQVHTYNYGFHGYGPQHLLARLDTQNLRTQIAEMDGSLVYLFIDAHLRRAIGSMIVYTGWADDAPYYKLGTDGMPAFAGTLTTGRPVMSMLYSLLGRSQLLKRLNVDVPLVITDHHIDWTARILAASAQRFRQQFSHGRFVVVIFPGSTHASRLGRALKQYGVEYLDYSTLFNNNDPVYLIPKDGHPSPRAHRYLADQLVKDLSLGGS